MQLVDLQVKHAFFDRDAVKELLDDESRQGLSRFGGYIRKTARSMVKRKGAARKPPKNQGGKAYERWLEEQERQPRSKPETAPFQHTTHPVVHPRNIWFAWDGKQSAVVGMAGFRTPSGDPVPHEIEFGSSESRRNPRRTTRKIGDGGEIELGLSASSLFGPGPKTAKLAANTRLGDIMVRYAKLRTAAQAVRANELNERLYGPEQLKSTTAPRPLMQLAFDKGLDKFEPAFSGRLVGG